MKAIWNNKVIAESSKTITVEKNHYFPPESIKEEYFKINDTYSFCHWKGKASYYDIIVDGKKNSDAAWFYAEPQPAAKDIQNYVAFWKGVEIVK